MYVQNDLLSLALSKAGISSAAISMMIMIASGILAKILINGKPERTRYSIARNTSAIMPVILLGEPLVIGYLAHKTSDMDIASLLYDVIFGALSGLLILQYVFPFLED